MIVVRALQSNKINNIGVIMKLSIAAFIMLPSITGLSACALPNVYHFNSVLEKRESFKTVDVYME